MKLKSAILALAAGLAAANKLRAYDQGHHRRHHHQKHLRVQAHSNSSESMPSFYHTTDEIHEALRNLLDNCPMLSMSALSKTSSVTGRKVTVDVFSVKNPEADPVNKVFVLFGEHPRELISSESGFHFIQSLCSNSKRVQDVLKQNEFKIIVNANPDSRRLVEKGEFCRRVNPDGVDLNRNWDEHWQQSMAFGGADANPGPKPFSEPETQILKQVAQEYKPTTFLTIHSGTLGMYMPWAFDMEHLADRNQAEMMQILSEIDAQHCQCPYGAAGKEVGYSCPGTCLDYIFDEVKAQYAFAYEIYVGDGREDLKARWKAKVASEKGALLQATSDLSHEHFRDIFEDFPSSFIQLESASERHHQQDYCFGMFNPYTKEEYDSTVENWSEVYLQTAEKVAARLEK
jgi:hypothetical protein